MEAGSAEENLPTRDFWHVIMVGVTAVCLLHGPVRSQDHKRAVRLLHALCVALVCVEGLSSGCC